MPKSPIRLAAEQLVKNYPNTPTRTLAKRLGEEFKVSIELARNHLRKSRGASGKAYRKYRAVAKVAKGKQGWKPEMPPSQAEPWEPYVLETGLTAILSDAHIPYHCETAVKAAINYCKNENPKTVLINGDWLDFYSVSRWQKDPRKRNLKGEIEAGKQSLQYIRNVFPEAKIVYKSGNHEERWNIYLWNHAPEICELANVTIPELLGFTELGIEFVEDQRPIMAGDLPIFHGHELGRSIFSPVNPARGAFLRTHHTVLVGHSHQTSSHADTNLWHQETFIWSTGCLCNLNPEYARVNRWNHGFAFADTAKDGSFNVRNMRISRSGKVRTS